jgi:hypothetical protein
MIRAKLPATSEILAVWGVTALALYGWTLTFFIWTLPSWEHFMTAGDLLPILLYSLPLNLLESLLVLAAALAACLCLPAAWYRERFVAIASLSILGGLGYCMCLASRLNMQRSFPQYLAFNASIPILAAIFFAAGVLSHVRVLRRGLEDFADRAIIFLYILIPLSLLALLAAAVRNLPGGR